MRISIITHKKKQINLITLFFSIITSFLNVAFAYEPDSCILKGEYQSVKWTKIIDGDTIKLNNGQTLRFASLNTPEIAHKNIQPEVYGKRSTKALRQLLRNNKILYIQNRHHSFDHYGRILANVFLTNKQSIEAILLKQGLALQYFSNFHSPYDSCLSQNELYAKKRQLGIWSTNPILHLPTKKKLTGFHIIQGKVLSIKKITKHNSYLIKLNGLGIFIDTSLISKDWITKLKNKTIQARGWVSKKKYHKKYRYNLSIYHYNSIKILQNP